MRQSVKSSFTINLSTTTRSRITISKSEDRHEIFNEKVGRHAYTKRVSGVGGVPPQDTLRKEIKKYINANHRGNIHPFICCLRTSH